MAVRAPGNSAQGHNGVRSVADALRTLACPRMRVGIGRPKDRADVATYVLARSRREERLSEESMAAIGGAVVEFASSLDVGDVDVER